MVDRTEYEIDHVIAEGMESHLADIIQKYPVLYDKDMKHRYGALFQSKSDVAWNKISDELNLELESCKSLWSCMKQKFIKHRKRLDNGEPINPWPTFNKLHKWLDRHVKKRKSRIDYIKQMKIPVSKTQLKCQTECMDDDEINEPDEEWAELLDDKRTTVQIQLKKRKSNDSMESLSQTTAIVSPKSDTKKKFNIEMISESGTTVYDDSEMFSDTSEQKSSIVVLEKAETSQIELIEVKDSIKSETTKASNNVDDFIEKIERILSKHIHSTEQRCIAENSMRDSNDAFGKYIASMVRELPSEKHMKIRLNILQYATELITKEWPN